MRVVHVSLTDFRNYATAELELKPGVNVLLGRNGQGKTNIAEAIMWFATLRSHRVSQDVALIRFGADAAVVRMKLAHEEREALLELQLNRGSANRFQVNRHAVRPREFTHLFSAVLFAPEDLAMVRGEPSLRRRFLDDALVLRYPVAAGVITDYERVLKQRNTLLKDLRRSQLTASGVSMLQVWDEQLVKLGSQIIEHRRVVARDLQKPLRDQYFQLVDGDHHPCLFMEETVDVSRETSAEGVDQVSVSRETIAQEFHSLIERHREREIERGQSLFGPHRDDLVFTLNHLPVKGFASHGEMWSFSLSLKLALASVLREDSPSGDPVLVLDDVFAELDTGRRGRLMAAIASFEQVIVTAAVAADVPEVGQGHVVRIDAGTIVEGAL